MKLRNPNAFEDGYDPVVDADTGEIKKALKKPNQNELFKKYCAFFEEQCEIIKGFKPEIGGIRDKVAFHNAVKKLTREEMVDIAVFFLGHKKSDEHISITACLSQDTKNLFYASKR